MQFDKSFTNKVAVCPPASNSITEYYNNASCMHLVDNIKVPTLAIHSRDDPVVKFDCMPLDTLKKNPNFIVAIPEYGGHMQYFEGNPGSLIGAFFL